MIAAFKLRGAQSDWADLLEAAYYADRPLLDGELQDILYHCAAFKAPRIFIQAPFLAELLNDDILRTIFSAHTKEVIVRYNRNDYQADFILGRMGKLLRYRLFYPGPIRGQGDRLQAPPLQAVR